MVERTGASSDQPLASPASPGWALWLEWVVASSVGWALGRVVVGGVLGVGDVLGVGVLQWLVLRRHVARAGWWVVASTVGWAVGWAVVFVVDGAVYGAINHWC